MRTVVAGQGFKPGIVLFRQDLATIEASALMVYGSDDPVGSKDLSEDFITSMPNAVLDVAADSGHLPWFDDPEGVGTLALSHLQTTTTRSA